MTLTAKILIFFGLIALFLVWVITPLFAGGVIDNNSGKLGDILVSTGINNGANSIGTWTDANFLKGEKGDIGLQGIQGVQGLQGIQGTSGINGLNGVNGTDGNDGYTPVKNIDYFDGKDGLNGIDGKDGLTGDTGLTGDKGDIGNTGNEGKAGKDVDPTIVNNLTQTNNEQTQRLNDADSRLSKLEKTQYVLETSFRILDTKRLTLRPFFRNNFTRNGMIDLAGLKVDIKLGKSYEEQQIEKINRRLDNIERIINHSPVIEKIVDKTGKIQSISITSNGLAVNGGF